MDIKDIPIEDIRDILKLIPNGFLIDDEMCIDIYNGIRYGKTVEDS